MNEAAMQMLILHKKITLVHMTDTDASSVVYLSTSPKTCLPLSANESPLMAE
jgi:hypothetical protein